MPMVHDMVSYHVDSSCLHFVLHRDKKRILRLRSYIDEILFSLTLIGPFLRTPTPNRDKPPTFSSNDIFVAASTIAAAAAETTAGSIIVIAMMNGKIRDRCNIVILVIVVSSMGTCVT